VTLYPWRSCKSQQEIIKNKLYWYIVDLYSAIIKAIRSSIDIDVMGNLTDIESVVSEGSKTDDASKPFNDPSVTGSSYESQPSRTQKTAITLKSTRIQLPVDPSVLQFMAEGDSDDDLEQKKAQLFCFCCCDLVRACIVANIVFIGCMVFLILISLYQTPFDNQLDLYMDYADDVVDKPGHQMDQKGIIALSRTSVSMIFALIAIVGAVRKSKHLLVCSTAGYFAMFVMNSMAQRWYGVAACLFFSYPNIHLFLALKSERITAENYQTQKYCCCEGCK